ncbi:Uncharacterised protein [Trueperella bialowiezensis]|uniref:Uncharacterized protein n=1 Tax=Trueperella bialowiezensis TaxID=312285 RepID=A0A3S4VG93_9ACTO|nr:Uncharacterised protein [Trueperella bialowiezensis]
MFALVFECLVNVCNCARGGAEEKSEVAQPFVFASIRRRQGEVLRGLLGAFNADGPTDEAALHTFIFCGVDVIGLDSPIVDGFNCS